MGTSIPSKDNESRGQGTSPVITTKLTPEEMEREIERLNKGRSPTRTKPQLKPPAKEKVYSQYTREDYLRSLANGESHSRIAQRFGLSAEGLGYWLGKWGLKEPEQEKAALKEYIAANLKPKEEAEMQKRRGPVPKENPDCGLTKQIYIEQIAAGETNASIERAWSMNPNSLYEWIKRWDLKGLKMEKAQELIEGVSVVDESPEADTDPVIASDAILNLTSEKEKLQAEIEHLRACSVNEISALRIAVETIDEMQLKVNELKQERDEAFKLLSDKENEGAATFKTEPQSVGASVPTQAFVSFALPLILIDEEPGVKRDRALERICDLNERISAGDIDYPRLAKETLELLQVVVSLVHAQTNDLTVKPEKVVSRVNEFFSHYNSQHIKRMEGLAAEYGWQTTQV
ncbi:MAG: hypothetical protein ACQEXQ_16055 [Bacillota bacterium]